MKILIDMNLSPDWVRRKTLRPYRIAAVTSTLELLNQEFIRQLWIRTSARLFHELAHKKALELRFASTVLLQLSRVSHQQLINKRLQR